MHCRITAYKKVHFKRVPPRVHWGFTLWCTNADSLKTRWHVLLKTKTCTIITEVFHFYATCFILRFLLIAFFKTVGELLHLLLVHPKLIFRSALKKALTVLEDRSYQTQHFAKIFASLLALMLYINFYLHSQESFENELWIVIALKSATFSAPETALETTYFMLFLKNLTKNLKKKLVIMFVWMEYINFTNISFFYMLHLFVFLLFGKTPQPCMVVYEAPPLLLSPKHLIICIC